MPDETALIASLKEAFPQYIGDDAAVIKKNDHQSTVLSKDLLVEDIHFRTAYVSPEDLAHKALHVNLSDLAAMGARPQFVLLGISIPIISAAFAHQFLDSFASACKQADVILIGGDTTRSPDKLLISVTAIGQARTAQVKYRHGAKPDDFICVAGESGHAHIGLLAFEQALTGFDPFKKDYLRPTAKIAEGLWLAKQSAVHTMMDISDGLLIDLKRLCSASQVAATIQLDQLPISTSFTAACKQLNKDPIEIALIGGEDYGLLCTIDPLNYQLYATQFDTTFGYPLKHIGTITTGHGVRLMQHTEEINVHYKSFSHFGELA
jgi:thiamine-monophosphate kinase